MLLISLFVSQLGLFLKASTMGTVRLNLDDSLKISTTLSRVQELESVV